ncbi:MAG: ROK family transcriptional regulator [Clostridia bacterium]|nr:ROK family transcriptional regulator [Clostridia bacterium]
MKSTNTQLILNKIHQHGSVSRVQIAKETGLTAATVTNLTGELISCGIIVEAEAGASSGGRKPIMLKFNSQEYAVCSVYISPDYVEFAVTDFDANPIYYNSVPVAAQADPRAAVEIIADEFDKSASRIDHTVVAMGVGLHGIVDHDSGVSIFAPNLEWTNVPIVQMLEERVHVPVFADNDVKLMAKGEMWYGAARNVSDFVYLYVGDGIGGAIAINGRLYRGSGNGSGEIGHCTVDDMGEICSCGNRGCLQTKASKRAMMSAVRKLSGDSLWSSRIADCDSLAAACLEGNPAAVAVMNDEAKYLAIGVTTLINLFNPKLVVVDSDIRDFDKAVMDNLKKEVAARKMKFFDNICDIEYSHLTESAVIKGATAMVLNHVFEQPAKYIK